jgi:hypothetical protein
LLLVVVGVLLFVSLLLSDLLSLLEAAVADVDAGAEEEEAAASLPLLPDFEPAA